MGVEGLFFAVEAFIVAIAVALAAFIADSLAIKSWWRYYGHKIMMMASPCSASSQTQSASNHDDSISMVGFVADSFGIKSWWSQHQFASHGVMTMEPPSLPLWKTHSTWFQHYFHCYLHPRLSCHHIVMIPCHHQCRFPNDQSMIMLTASPGLPWTKNHHHSISDLLTGSTPTKLLVKYAVSFIFLIQAKMYLAQTALPIILRPSGSS